VATVNSDVNTGPITPHFTWEEANCRCGCVMPGEIAWAVSITANWAEKIRVALGDVPMFVTSWYRCPTYNALIGGKPDSQHLLGRAIDFVVKHEFPAVIQYKLRPWVGVAIQGLGCYHGFTHIDRRDGPSAVWFS
jgi:hypothetical protein